jgi:metallophosphoesterase superfamily enzyme
MANKENFLLISDVHLPYEYEHALRFCKELKKDFDVPHSNVYSVGDIADLYGFSRWPKSPDAKHTINQELELLREKIRKWGAVFPEMKIAHSNHDMRVMRKAISADLPSQVIRSVEEIMEFPKGWELREQFVVMANKCEFLVTHGEEYPEALDAAMAYGVNVVQGHHHGKAGVRYRCTKLQQLWGLSVGCLVDKESFAFQYGAYSKQKPIIGCGLILNGMPHFISVKL